MANVQQEKRIRVLKTALARGDVIDASEKPAVFFFDENQLRYNIQMLRKAFGKVDALHTIAVKANPLLEVLKICKDEGIGAEAASLGELEIAVQAGFGVNSMLYDSPTKTYREIQCAIEKKVMVNADNIEEINSISEILQDRPYEPGIGLRVNPGLGQGTIKELSTATAHSKFGLNIGDYHDQIVSAFETYSWLTRLHIHTGSQGCSLDLMVRGVQEVVQLARVINAKVGFKKVKDIDIGGGLPISYHNDDETNHFQMYFELLQSNIENFDDLEFRLITEMGRSLMCKCGFATSFIEYTKHAGGRSIALQHLGADTLLRTAYLPDHFTLRVFCLDKNCKPLESEREGGVVETDVGGPLCFSGDLLARNRLLPPLQRGDLIIVPDVGAYSLSMFSHYNSRPFPDVWLYKESHSDSAAILLRQIRKQDSIQQVVNFWKAPP